MRPTPVDQRRDRDAEQDERRRRREEVVHCVRDDHCPAPLRKACLTATVGDAMLLISLYVRRILTVPRESASETAAGAR